MTTTAKATHTPGPWVARSTAGHNVHGQSAIYSETDGKDIAIVYDGDANADIIAAAPELLGALEAVNESATDGREIPEWLYERLVAVQAAIQKARGNQ